MYSDAETLPENKKRGGASMRGQFENSLGTVSIDSEVVATYAGSVAVECFGIVGMAAVNMKDGLVKLLKKDYLHHGISVKIEENNRITLDFHVIVSYGNAELCRGLRKDPNAESEGRSLCSQCTRHQADSKLTE